VQYYGKKWAASTSSKGRHFARNDPCHQCFGVQTIKRPRVVASAAISVMFLTLARECSHIESVVVRPLVVFAINDTTLVIVKLASVSYETPVSECCGSPQPSVKMYIIKLRR
jgi:hypothetical protein